MPGPLAMWNVLLPRDRCDTAEPHPARGVFKGRRSLACSVAGEQLSEEKAAPGIPVPQRGAR